MSLGDVYFDFRLDCPAIGDIDSVEVHSVYGRDSISQLFHYQITALVHDAVAIDETELMDSEASLVFVRDDGTEHFRLFGMISGFLDTGVPSGDRFTVELEFVPRAARAAMYETLDVFVDHSVPEIIEARLTNEKRAGFKLKEGDGEGDISLENVGSSYATREFTVQYREPDMSFLQRLAENWGIHFHVFHDQENGVDVLVFGDTNDAFKKVRGPSENLLNELAQEVGVSAGEDGLHVRYQISQMGQPYTVFELERKTTRLIKTVIEREYNYQTPDVDLTAEAEVDPNGIGHRVEYAACGMDPDELQKLADIRAEMLRAEQHVFSGRSTVPTLYAGGVFTVTNHPRGDLELLVTEVHHRFETVDSGSGARSKKYTNAFTAIESSTPYRPRLLTPKPRVSGSITGTVNPSAESDYAELDGDGRYNVRFHFDTDYDEDPKQDGRASHKVRMAQPHAGPGGYGMHFPLRGGVEVMLTCLDGDPDRPVISGCLPNPNTGSPVNEENNAHNVIATGGGSKIDIDDTEGSTRMRMCVPHCETLIQMGAPEDAEEGVLVSTEGNIVQRAKEVGASIAKIRGIYSDDSITAGTGVIVNFAGGYPLWEWFKSASEWTQIAEEAASMAGQVFGGGGVASAGTDFISHGVINMNGMVKSAAYWKSVASYADVGVTCAGTPLKFKTWDPGLPSDSKTNNVLAETTVFIWSGETILNHTDKFTALGDSLVTIASGDKMQIASKGDMQLAVNKDYFENIDGNATTVLEKDLESTINGKSKLTIKKDTEASITEGKLKLAVEKGGDVAFAEGGLKLVVKKGDYKKQVDDGKFELKVKKKLAMETEDDADLKSKKKYSLKGDKEIALEHGGGGMKGKSADTQVFHGGTKLTLKSSGAELKGSKVDIKGKVFLG